MAILGDFQYWPESHGMWWAYFAAGFVLAVYVFYVFIGSLHMLFLHDVQEPAVPLIGERRDGGEVQP